MIDRFYIGYRMQQFFKQIFHQSKQEIEHLNKQVNQRQSQSFEDNNANFISVDKNHLVETFFTPKEKQIYFKQITSSIVILSFILGTDNYVGLESLETIQSVIQKEGASNSSIDFLRCYYIQIGLLKFTENNFNFKEDVDYLISFLVSTNINFLNKKSAEDALRKINSYIEELNSLKVLNDKILKRFNLFKAYMEYVGVNTTSIFSSFQCSFNDFKNRYDYSAIIKKVLLNKQDDFVDYKQANIDIDALIETFIPNEDLYFLKVEKAKMAIIAFILGKDNDFGQSTLNIFINKLNEDKHDKNSIYLQTFQINGFKAALDDYYDVEKDIAYIASQWRPYYDAEKINVELSGFVNKKLDEVFTFFKSQKKYLNRKIIGRYKEVREKFLAYGVSSLPEI